MTEKKHAVKAPAADEAVKGPVTDEATVGEKPAAKKATGKGRMFTYVGAGDSSSYVINLMGKQTFRRGELTEVTDPELLAKLPGIPTFVEGEADAETLHKIDQEGKEAVERQRALDLIINAKFTKKHVGE